MKPYEELMPGQAILVTGLKYEIVRRMPYRDIWVMPRVPICPVPDSDDVLIREAVIDIDRVPIQQFSRMQYGERQDMFIGWSLEVEEMLNTPFRILKDNIESLEKNTRVLDRKLSAFYNASLWKRIKYLFTSKV